MNSPTEAARPDADAQKEGRDDAYLPRAPQKGAQGGVLRPALAAQSAYPPIWDFIDAIDIRFEHSYSTLSIVILLGERRFRPVHKGKA